MRKIKYMLSGVGAEACPVCGQLRAPNQVQSILDQLPARGYVRQKLLLQLVPISKSKLWRDCLSGEFPKPYKIAPRVTGWRVEEVRQWFIDKGLAT